MDLLNFPTDGEKFGVIGARRAAYSVRILPACRTVSVNPHRVRIFVQPVHLFRVAKGNEKV